MCEKPATQSRSIQWPLLKRLGLGFGSAIALVWPMAIGFNPVGLAIVARGVSSRHVAVQSAVRPSQSAGVLAVELTSAERVAGILARLTGILAAIQPTENPLVFAELADELAMRYECSVYNIPE